MLKIKKIILFHEYEIGFRNWRKEYNVRLFGGSLLKRKLDSRYKGTETWGKLYDEQFYNFYKKFGVSRSMNCRF
jgi:hypothetical protein